MIKNFPINILTNRKIEYSVTFGETTFGFVSLVKTKTFSAFLFPIKELELNALYRRIENREFLAKRLKFKSIQVYIFIDSQFIFS
jgi:hypothetical protein